MNAFHIAHSQSVSAPRRRHPLLIALTFFLLAGAAWAGNYAHSASHVTAKSKAHVLSVLTAYNQTCDSGCKYKGENVKTFIKVSQKASPSRWYTWTHVTNTLKSTKYFSEVSYTDKGDGFVFVTRQLEEKDKSLIEELKKATGKDHNPVFDTGVTRFTVAPVGDGKLKVTQAMKLSATGMVTMFPGKIQAGMESGARLTFKNIEK